MNRNLYLLEIGLLSGILGFVSEYFGSLKALYIILVAIIFIDTLTGVIVAVRNKRFSSKGIKKFLKKAISYGAAIFTVRLMEISLQSFFKTSVMSQITGIFLVITESVSTLENLTLLGVPLPSNFVSVLMSNINIPGLKEIIKKMPEYNDRVLEIVEIADYSVKNTKNQNTKIILEMYFEMWINLARNLNGFLKGTDNKELQYYKILSQIEMLIRDLNIMLEESDIEPDRINAFKKSNEVLMNQWFDKIKKICYSNDGVKCKEQQLLDSIIVLLYRTIIDGS